MTLLFYQTSLESHPHGAHHLDCTEDFLYQTLLLSPHQIVDHHTEYCLDLNQDDSLHLLLLSQENLFDSVHLYYWQKMVVDSVPAPVAVLLQTYEYLQQGLIPHQMFLCSLHVLQILFLPLGKE